MPLARLFESEKYVLVCLLQTRGRKVLCKQVNHFLKGPTLYQKSSLSLIEIKKNIKEKFPNCEYEKSYIRNKAQNFHKNMTPCLYRHLPTFLHSPYHHIGCLSFLSFPTSTRNLSTTSYTFFE